jgi:hypothetical protein
VNSSADNSLPVHTHGFIWSDCRVHGATLAKCCAISCSDVYMQWNLLLVVCCRGECCCLLLVAMVIVVAKLLAASCLSLFVE